MAADPMTPPRTTGTTDTAGAAVVLAGVLRARRRSLLLWAIAVAAVSAIYASFYPAIGDEQMEAMTEMMPEDLAVALGYDQLGDAAGYLSASVYGLLGPALLLVFGIGAGARLLAGDEEDGTLELELTHPVDRLSVYLGRLATLWLELVVLAGAAAIVIAVLVGALDMDVSVGGLVAGSLGLLLLAGAHATVTLAVGAATGRRAVALAAGAGLAVLGYVANALGPVADLAWLTAVSPWAWFLEDEPLRTGIDVGGFALLLLLAVVPAALGALRYTRRDLGV